jgi:hypothetical protein
MSVILTWRSTVRAQRTDDPRRRSSPVVVGSRAPQGRPHVVAALHRLVVQLRPVERGQAGRVGQGLNAGGLTYGYAPVPGELGKRQIVEEEAEIIRRIFDEYVSGRTPREILETDVKDIFSRLGLDRHLSTARKNGLMGMVQRIREIARRAA